jgi:hypothetical protein
MSLYGRGLAKRRLGEARDSAADFEQSAKLSPRANRRASAFFDIKD